VDVALEILDAAVLTDELAVDVAEAVLVVRAVASDAGVTVAVLVPECERERGMELEPLATAAELVGDGDTMSVTLRETELLEVLVADGTDVGDNVPVVSMNV
jgi:hypothetical protein